jgi:hypothetical protein
MKLSHNKNIFLDNLKYAVLLCAILLACLLPMWLFGTGVTDLACVRSLDGVECSLVRRSRFFKISEIEIHHPIAVDLSQDERHSRGTIVSVARAEIRLENVSYKTNIYYGYDLEVASTIAREINEFLLSSNTHSFHKVF